MARMNFAALVTLALLGVSSTTWAAADFDTANRHLAEQSHSKACDEFTAFIAANKGSELTREAQAKRAAACGRAGKINWSELTALASTGPNDFARAWAMGFSAEQGMTGVDPALAELKKYAKGEDRTAQEATRAIVKLAMLEIERNSYNPARVEVMTQTVIGFSNNPNEVAHARYARALSNFNDSKKVASAEKELSELAGGTSDWADDAMFQLGNRRENEAKYPAALEWYDGLQKFSAQSSNVRSDGLSRAANIRRKSVSVSIYQFTVPGEAPKVAANWRNVKSANWVLKRVEPSAFATNSSASNLAELFSSGTVVKSWSTPLESAGPYAPGHREFDLPTTEPGAYVLEMQADSERSTSSVLITQYVVLTKTDHNRTLAWVSDVETGAAQPNATAYLWSYDNNGHWGRVEAKTDAQGLATFTVEHPDHENWVWVKVGQQWTTSRGGYWYASSYGREELAYVMFDRPLYKPNETVGFKVFLRTREGGPTQPLANRAIDLVITDPTGKTVAEPKLTTNEFGTASATLALPKNATLGAWRAYVRASNVSYQQLPYNFRVEEFKPPEYTVSVEAVGNPKPGEPVKFKVKASYYSGGPVANASGRMLVNVMQWSHQWKRWPDEKGDQEDGSSSEEEWRYRRYGYGYRRTLGNQTLTFKTGADGTAEVEAMRTPEGESNAEYTVQVMVTDASRREITGSGSARVSATPYFVDVRTGHSLYKPGERVAVDLRAEDPNGRPAAPEVVVRLMKIGEGGQLTKIAEARTALKQGKGLASLDADALGPVRVEVTDASDAKVVLAQTDVWLTNEAKPMMPQGPGFQLYVDKAPLRVGQKLRALVTTDRAGGHFFATVDNEQVQFAAAFELTGRARFFEVPMTADMGPNAWLQLARFEDMQWRQHNHPLRVVGTDVDLGVKVDLGRPVVEPGSSITASVTAKNAPPKSSLEVALTVVDEALFAIEKERTDFMTFFGRHARQLSVRTTSTLNDHSFAPRTVKAQPRQEPAKTATGVGAENQGEMRGRALAEKEAPMPVAAPGAPPSEEMVADKAEASSVGRREAKKSKDSRRDEDDSSGPAANGADAKDPAVKVRTNFGSSSGWYPALSTTAGRAVNQSIQLTDSLTSWKSVATVVSDSAFLGQGSASIRTAKPLMVRLQGPRFFIENDEVVLSAVVESHLPATTDVDVSIVAPGLKPLDAAAKKLRIEPEQIVRFDVRFKVTDLGERTVQAIVKGGKTSDAMEWKLPALVHGSAQRQFFAGRLSDHFKVEFDLPEKRKAALTNFELVLSPSVLSVMFDSLPYLAAYPYGCVEQTLSRFVPAVIARRTAKQFNVSEERVPQDLDLMVQQGLDRLVGFQHSDGGWGWWQTDSTNRWMTAYVVYALSLTKEAGVPVDAGVLARGRNYLSSHLGEGLNDPETHAFMTFALSATGGAPKVGLDADFAKRTSLSPRGRALVALSLLNAKDPRARIAVENLDDIVTAAKSRPDAAVGEANDVWSTSAAIEATALTLMAMTRYDLNSPLIQPLTDFLVLRRNGGKWRTTRDTAFAVYALSELAKREGAALRTGSFVVFVNGREVKRVSFAKGGLDLKAITLPDQALKAGHNVVEVKRDSGGTGYFAATFDVFNQNDFIKGVGGDVKIKRTYTLLGKPSTTPGSAPTEYGMPVESGTRVRVDVDITANKAVEFVMIEDLKAAGFEAVMQRSGPEVCQYQCAHAELRSDRVAMFLPQIPVGTTRVSYELRAEVPGRFAALPARAEAMYAPEIQATADEMRFEVRDEPSAGVVQK